jgi:hypothetical protein
MSRDALYEGVFGDGKYRFRLGIAELEELQEKTDAGPEEVFWRLQGVNWRLADIRDTIRLGLIGAGRLPTEALVLTERYCKPGWLASWKPLASAIIGAALNGAPDEDAALGETKGETETISPDAKSDSPPSTD